MSSVEVFRVCLVRGLRVKCSEVNVPAHVTDYNTSQRHLCCKVSATVDGQYDCILACSGSQVRYQCTHFNQNWSLNFRELLECKNKGYFHVLLLLTKTEIPKLISPCQACGFPEGNSVFKSKLDLDLFMIHVMYLFTKFLICCFK